MKPHLVTLACALLAAALLGACQPQATPLSEPEKNAVLLYSEDLTGNLLEGLNAANYATFSRDFDDAMKKGIPESNFTSTRAQIVDKVGKYVSRQVSDVFELQGNIVVNYIAKFEQDDQVSVRVVFTKDAPHKITGLWFNSPKMSGK